MSRFIFARFTRYFDEVARHGSIRKAAEELSVSASAIDRQLLQAEEAFGVALFERLPRGVRLTAAGEILIYGVRRWQRDLDRIEFEIEELRGLRRGQVRVAVAQETTFDFVPNALASFMQDHPRISHHVVVAESDRVRQLVLDGQADFGLSFNPQPSPVLRVERTAKFRLSALVPKDHPLAKLGSPSLAQCFQHPVIIPDASVYLRDVIDAAIAKSKARVQPILSANNLEFIKAMVAQGRGVGLMTTLGDASDHASSGLVCLTLSDKGLVPSTLSLIVASERHLSVASILAMRYFAVYFDDMDRQSRFSQKV